MSNSRPSLWERPILTPEQVESCDWLGRLVEFNPWQKNDEARKFLLKWGHLMPIALIVQLAAALIGQSGTVLNLVEFLKKQQEPAVPTEHQAAVLSLLSALHAASTPSANPVINAINKE